MFAEREVPQGPGRVQGAEVNTSADGEYSKTDSQPQSISDCSQSLYPGIRTISRYTATPRKMAQAKARANVASDEQPSRDDELAQLRKESGLSASALKAWAEHPNRALDRVDEDKYVRRLHGRTRQPLLLFFPDLEHWLRGGELMRRRKWSRKQRGSGKYAERITLGRGVSKWDAGKKVKDQWHTSKAKSSDSQRIDGTSDQSPPLQRSTDIPLFDRSRGRK